MSLLNNIYLNIIVYLMIKYAINSHNDIIYHSQNIITVEEK